MYQFESDVPNVPDHTLAHKQFLMQHVGAAQRQALAAEILAAVKTHQMAPYYQHLAAEMPADFPLDDALYRELAAHNAARIAELELTIQQAQADDESEIDVVAETGKLAQYCATILDRKRAAQTHEALLALTPGTGPKIDVLLTMARMDFFFHDLRGVARHLAEAQAWIDKGGDWERRNRYKTYQGVYHLATRNFAEAAALLLDSLATFTSTELCSYEEVAQYAVVAGLLTLGRVDVKLKIVDSPEILAIRSSAPGLEPLVCLTNTLYTCQYGAFLQHLLATHDRVLATNRYLCAHAGFFMREMRCKAYAQMLDSYKSLSLPSMARRFGVSELFLDADLCRFIPSGKLNCTIDRVNGIIETNRPDNKNSQFHQLIKLGDGLLTKLQKYGAAVKLSGAERV
ncbi:PCI-domain-containing protein [Metschnikowia bicuspidata var. bicuspidata NRRL YB-4993]|uniref:PCI-domain-containing protein n=1 Tax=Metschnikowia bicuspidata var. bicuspidata NRRL YB-4993 TaxID=869754 RepID=A0A1A0HG05_9ASCO|nr:PCI-domain-containing protein [Metschnikowia bicuspidata var. bicuspidata NRRL YB-4993]OBA22827.1 PCI-domain-containing protein [Metschnikowia bicuspidata var. bicuspidata NRRL YB-4993]